MRFILYKWILTWQPFKKWKKKILLLLVFATFSFTETEKKSNTDGYSAFTKVA